MILGIGTDITQVVRIRDTIERYGDQFLKRIFTDNERSYCEAQKYSAQHYAARFAAKEAFSKAVGTGIEGETVWTHVEVVRHLSGKPMLELHGALAEQFRHHHLHLSLSHTTEHAIACVIVETPNTIQQQERVVEIR